MTKEIGPWQGIGIMKYVWISTVYAKYSLQLRKLLCTHVNYLLPDWYIRVLVHIQYLLV